jgi:hypothetical protein
MANERFRSDRERDPIAELARLIGQADRQRRNIVQWSESRRRRLRYSEKLSVAAEGEVLR